MENSSKYFKNIQCQYYPCHKGIQELNCLFCFCPMYTYQKCLGNPTYIKNGEKMIKDCSHCVYPHDPSHYDSIMKFLTNI